MSARHRPIARNPISEVGDDDLTTWTSTASLTTASLPGTNANLYPLVVDVTNIISAPAKADTGALRFRHENGVRFSHKRTPGGRILLIGTFTGGVNKINYYWGKSGATQPGGGFQTADEALAGYRLGLIFDNNAPLDITPTPASWTVVGAPTYETYQLGQAMKFSEGNYIETTAAKLRENAREVRAVYASITLPTATDGGRILCWANWPINQRAFQLWMRSDGLELYTSDNGTSFQRRLLLEYQQLGANGIGCSWKAGRAEALMLCNQAVQTVLPDGSGSPTGTLFNSTDPYIVGGTKIPGSDFNGTVRAVFELYNEFVSENHLLVWRMAWEENDVFWGIADRTPDNIDVPEIVNVPLSSEVAFAKKEVTGISAGTPIAVYGGGNPTYSIGSSFTSASDIKSKGSTAGTIGPGNWISSYHTSASINSSVQESYVTVGTVTSPRRSTTVAASGGGGGPGGPATYTVNSVSGLVSAFNSAKPGEVIEITQGDYKSQGKLTLQNKDFRGGAALEIRCNTLPYRGYLASEGGLLVPDETFFTTGSGGAEFAGLMLRNIHNIVFKGIRVYQGDVGTAGAKYYGIDCISCTRLTFENVKLCGFKPLTAKKLWATDKYRPTSGWYNQGRGMQIGVSGACSNITFKKSLLHYFGDIGFYNANSPNTIFEDCVFSDQMSDHLRTDGPQDNFTARRCIFYRTWGRKSSSGGIAHCDHVQNSSKDQPGWRNHTFDSCIFTPGDNAYPHIQSTFYEHDKPLEQPIGYDHNVINCLIESRVVNTIYSRPGNRLNVTNTTIIQNQFGGLNEMNEAGNDSLLDTVWHSPLILVSSTTGNGKSYGNNTIKDSVYFGHDFNTGIGDKVLTSTQLLANQYTTQLFDYPLYNGPIRTTTQPALPLMSAAAFRPTRLLNSSYVLDVNELKRMAPKANAAIHPNQQGKHYGCSALFQTLGALP
jgi:hypothetical protein